MNNPDDKPRTITATSHSRLRRGVSTRLRAGKAKTADKAFQAMDAYIRG